MQTTTKKAVSYPQFPTNLGFLAGLFDAVYTAWRTRGQLVLSSTHAAPLEVIQNWFPGKYHRISDTYHTLNISGAPAYVLLGCVKKHVRITNTEAFPDIDHGRVELIRPKDFAKIPHEDTSWLLGYFYGCVGDVTSKEVYMIPFDYKKNRKFMVVKPQVSSIQIIQEEEEDLKVTLNSNAFLLHRVLKVIYPPIPETITKQCQVCLRQRLVNRAIQDYNKHILGQRPRHSSMSREQKEILRKHVHEFGTNPLCRLMGLSVKQVKAFLDSDDIDHSAIQTNTLNTFIKTMQEEGVDVHSIKSHVRNKYGVNLSIGAINMRARRKKQSSDQKSV